MTFRALPGFRDFPPEELAFRTHILAAWRRVATRYGFTEYDGPPLEPLELYTSRSGDEKVQLVVYPLRVSLRIYFCDVLIARFNERGHIIRS